MRQGLLDGQEVVADLDDVLDGLFDSLADAVGGVAKLVSELEEVETRLNQINVELDDSNLPKMFKELVRDMESQDRAGARRLFCNDVVDTLPLPGLTRYMIKATIRLFL